MRSLKSLRRRLPASRKFSGRLTLDYVGPKRGSRQLLRPSGVLLILGCLLSGCDGCDRTRSAQRRSPKAAPLQCSSLEDCEDDSPCTREACVEGRCLTSHLVSGTSCDNQTVCDGVAKCDGKGRCSAGPAPAIDDGNACTTDSCDPVRGVTHEPISFDDFDACTEDACDPRTGQITHNSLPIDDQDDCTFDSCDRDAGVKHQKPSAIYTCAAGCGAGFHPASRTPSAQCGASQGLQTFCVPDCGGSFYVCDARCPAGYHSSTRTLSAQCGASPAPRTFCQKNAGGSFYTCDGRCPEGYLKRAEAASGDCGSPATSKLFCSKI